MILRKKPFVFVLYWLVAGFIFAMWVWGADSPNTSFNGDSRSTLSGLIYGTAYNPYVQRALVPILSRGIHQLVPDHLESSISAALVGIPKFRRETVRLGWEQQYLSEYLIALFLAYLSLTGFAFVIRSLFRRLYKTAEEVSNMIPVIALLCLPAFFFVGPHYVYDFPAMFFFSLGLVLILTSEWSLFYPVFVLGCINKETAAFLTIGFMALHVQQMERKSFYRHMFLQLSLFLIVKSLLVYSFRENPGPTLEFHLYGNLHSLLLPYSFATLFLTGALVVLVLYDIGKKPWELRQSMWILVPFGLSLILFGWISEIRALYEIFPIIFLLAIHTVMFSIFKVFYQYQSVSTTN